jgi:menaquinone-dependent protoporphyrinogen oxidase
VLGAPLYIGSMLKDAVAFLERHRAALERIRVAVFVLGPISAEDSVRDGRGQLDDALAKVSWLSPVASEIFIGKYDPAKLRLADKLIAVLPASPLHGVGPQDGRDWAAIDAWAEELPAVLGPE